MYTVKEISDIMNLAEVSVRKMIRLGRMKGKKLGNTWVVTERELQKILKERGITVNLKEIAKP